MESLDLVTSNAEEARTWITGLRYLMAGISDEDSLAKRQRTHDQYPSNKRIQYRPALSGEPSLWVFCGLFIRVFFSKEKALVETSIKGLFLLKQGQRRAPVSKITTAENNRNTGKFIDRFYAYDTQIQCVSLMCVWDVAEADIRGG